MKTALFIFAHNDDMPYMACGTLLKQCKINRVILEVLCANVDPKYRSILVNFAICHNIELVEKWNQPLQLNQTIVKKEFDYAIRMYNPSIVFTHSLHDNHFEHRMLAEESLVACRPLDGLKHPSQLFHCAFQSTLQTFGAYGSFKPNYFVDISGYISTKLEILSKYEAQKVIPDSSTDNRSVESTETFNKIIGHSVGCEYAEGFEQIFRID